MVPLTGKAVNGREEVVCASAPPDLAEPEKDFRGVAMPDILRDRDPSVVPDALPRERPGVVGREAEGRVSTSE